MPEPDFRVICINRAAFVVSGDYFLSACRQTRAQRVPRIFPRTRRGATYHAQEVTSTPPKGTRARRGSRRKEGGP